MKRTVAIILAFVIAMSALSGCALKKKLTAFGLYSKAVNDIRKAGGYEIEGSISLDLSLLTVDMDIRAKQNGDSYDMAMSVMGEDYMRMTVIDGIAYINTMGEKYKYAVSKDDEVPELGKMSALPKIAEEIFNNVEVTENEDGTKSVTTEIGEEVFAEVLGAFEESLGDTLSFKNTVMTMNFDEDDNITYTSVSADSVISDSGISMTMKLTMEYNYINLGTAPEVTLPDDADEYVFSMSGEAA